MNTTDAHTPGSLRVGWIGAGRMGAAMASRLARAGEDVTVWNRTRAKAEALTEVGCKVADTIADLRGHDVVFTMVSTPADLEQVLIGDGRPAGRPGRTSPACVVDCSTVSTESSAAMRAACDERGVAFLASPVSGNGKVVRAGGLSLVVSGPEETYRRVEPLLDHLGKGATYVGEGEQRPAGQDLPQRHARRRHPVPGRDHRARREGRDVARGVPGVPQQQS